MRSSGPGHLSVDLVGSGYEMSLAMHTSRGKEEKKAEVIFNAPFGLAASELKMVREVMLAANSLHVPSAPTGKVRRMCLSCMCHTAIRPPPARPRS